MKTNWKKLSVFIFLTTASIFFGQNFIASNPGSLGARKLSIQNESFYRLNEAKHFRKGYPTLITIETRSAPATSGRTTLFGSIRCRQDVSQLNVQWHFPDLSDQTNEGETVQTYACSKDVPLEVDINIPDKQKKGRAVLEVYHYEVDGAKIGATGQILFQEKELGSEKHGLMTKSVNSSPSTEKILY